MLLTKNIEHHQNAQQPASQVAVGVHEEAQHNQYKEKNHNCRTVDNRTPLVDLYEDRKVLLKSDLSFEFNAYHFDHFE